MQALARDVPIASHVMAYAVRILRGTHPEARTHRAGAQVRALRRLAAWRACDGARAKIHPCSTAASTWPSATSRPWRPRPAPSDHLNFEGEARGINSDSVVRAIIAETPTEPAE